MQTPAKIIMVGAFPPPIHGMAIVNSAVREYLIASSVTPTVIDISGTTLDRSLISRVSRFPKLLFGLLKLTACIRYSNPVLYIAISGGLGQILEIPFLIIARLKRMRIFVHHHSFAYISNPTLYTRLLLLIGGSNATHITQSNGMSDELQKQYSINLKSVPISNSVYMLEKNKSEPTAHTSLKTIGFLSNISANKGIYEFIDLLHACNSAGLNISAKIAGPFQDASTQSKVLDRISTLKNVEYVGPVYGKDKETFFNDIDVLIFPTLYNNETEGIVNHESLSYSVPVIAYGRGCIPEILNSDCGLVIDPSTTFVPNALLQITTWVESPKKYTEASRSARRQFLSSFDTNYHIWGKLLHDILN